MPEAKSEIANSLVPVTKQQAMLMLEAAYLWMDMGKFDNAREVLTGAAALMPRSEVPQLALGTLEFNQGHYDKALQAFRRAQQLAPRASLPRAHCGEALLFMGKVNEAMKELKSALELEPDSDGAKFAQSLIDAKEAGALPPAKAAKE
jgi:predicted Zn-dependent protease